MLLGVTACTKQENNEEVNNVQEAETINTTSKGKIYFAGPLFNQAEKDYNLKIALPFKLN